MEYKNLGKITTISGTKYNIIQQELMKSMHNGWWENQQLDARGTYWRATCEEKNYKIGLFVKCDYVLPTFKDFTGISEEEFYQRFTSTLYEAFVISLFYDSVNNYINNTIEFTVDEKGENPLGFKYEKIKGELQFTYNHPQKTDFQRNLSLNVQKEILDELHKNYKVGIELEKLENLIFFDSTLIKENYEILTLKTCIEIRNGLIFITEPKGENWRSYLQQQLETIRTSTSHIGFKTT